MSNYNTTLQSNNDELQAILEAINELPEASSGGVELPTLTNEGSASDLLSGKQLIDGDGNIVTGTIATKTSSNLTVNGATVTVPSGYYSAQATKTVSTATQATPSVSIDANGKITATATQTAGYVAAGTKSGTKQLAFQAAKTITPSTASQIAVSSGYYTGGNITVVGDSNLVAGNIKSGVSIFGVSGNYEGSGGDTSVEDALVARAFSSYTNDRVESIGNAAFYSYSNLTSVSFPACITIGDDAFRNCSKLTSVNFPACSTIGFSAFYSCSNLTSVNFPICSVINGYAFDGCSNLTSVNFPICSVIRDYAFDGCRNLTSVSFPACSTIGFGAFGYCFNLTSVNFPACSTIGFSAFRNCSKLTSVSFPACRVIGSAAFSRCYNLKYLYLMGSSVCALNNSNVFYSTPIGGYSASAGAYGSIYVPASLLTSYQTATNWTYFSSRFVGVDDGYTGQ